LLPARARAPHLRAAHALDLGRRVVAHLEELLAHEARQRLHDGRDGRVVVELLPRVLVDALDAAGDAHLDVALAPGLRGLGLGDILLLELVLVVLPLALLPVREVLLGAPVRLLGQHLGDARHRWRWTSSGAAPLASRIFHAPKFAVPHRWRSPST
jgi:GNAT superfamily N-acetyltransferase